MTVADDDTYQHEFGATNIEQLPLYIPDNWVIEEKQGTGTYCLYHGDLSVDANEKAAIWLLDKVFSKTNIPLVITGYNPSEKLENWHIVWDIPVLLPILLKEKCRT